MKFASRASSTESNPKMRAKAGLHVMMRPSGSHDEIAGKILLHETAVTFFAFAQSVVRQFPRGDIGIDLHAQRVGFVVRERPTAIHAYFRAVTPDLAKFPAPARLLRKPSSNA